MTRSALIVDSLSKSYRLGAAQTRATSLREVATNILKAPLKRLRETREPSHRDRSSFWALRDVSFQINHGEVVGIVGHNGAGKSTLLKVFSRIVEPTSGSVRLRGRLSSLLEVGTGFHPELTGRENVYLNGSILGMKRAEIARKFDEIVAFSGIEPFLDTPVKRYSSGMYVRLAFAVAAHLEPDILIIDEVLAVGDAEFQAKCLGKLREVTQGEGRTVLFVSHNLNAVLQLCHRAIYLKQGRVEADGPADEVMQLYGGQGTSEVSVDTTNHPNRPEKLHKILRRVELFDEQMNPSAHFAPMETITVQLELAHSTRIQAPNISLGIDNRHGERVFAVGTLWTQSHVPSIQDSATVAVTFQLPPLVPGRYTMNIGVREGSSMALDNVPRAASFEIKNTNYLQSSKPIFREMGHVMVRSDWKVLDPVSVA